MRKLINFLFLAVITLWSLGPFIWQLITSFKEPSMVSQLPPVFSFPISFDNYASVFTNQQFLNVIWNSMVVALCSTILSLAVGSLAAFGISRLLTRGKTAVLFMLLVIFMIPQVALVMPLYKLVIGFDLHDTRLGLILLYTVFTVPLSVWIMHQVFDEVPISLYRAALVDGCSHFKIFYKIYVPLGAGGLVSAGLLSLIFCWNEFLFALTFTSTYASRTIPVGITLFSGQYEFPWGEISAATSVVTFPILLIIIFAQKYLVRGLVGSSIKG